QAYPWLYWHPLVRLQISHLRKLTRDWDEWERLGWKMWTDKEGLDRDPNEVGQVWEALRDLVRAHVAGLFPGQRITLIPKANAAGRPSGIKNPHAAYSVTERIDARTLDESERDLRRFFSGRKAELTIRPPERKADAISRIEKLARKALDETHAAWWSDRKHY